MNKRIQCMVYLHNGALFRYKKNITISFVEKLIEIENRLIKRQTGRQTDKVECAFSSSKDTLQSYRKSRKAGRDSTGFASLPSAPGPVSGDGLEFPRKGVPVSALQMAGIPCNLNLSIYLCHCCQSKHCLLYPTC